MSLKWGKRRNFVARPTFRVMRQSWSEYKRRLKFLFSHHNLTLRETLFTCLTWTDTMPSLSKNHGVIKIAVFSHCFPEKKNQQLEFLLSCWFSMWTSLGLNQGPPDYESVALTNWATSPVQFWFCECKGSNFILNMQIFCVVFCGVADIFFNYGVYRCYLQLCDEWDWKMAVHRWAWKR